GCFEADPALLRLDAPFARAGLSCAADAKCGRSEEENGYGHPRRTPAETGQHSLDDPVLEHGMAQSAGEMERYERQQGIAENSVRALENILVSLFVACRQIAQPGQQRKGRKLEKNGRLVRDRDHSPAGHRHEDNDQIEQGVGYKSRLALGLRYGRRERRRRIEKAPNKPQSREREHGWPKRFMQ